eukprot:s4574_g1.t1
MIEPRVHCGPVSAIWLSHRPKPFGSRYQRAQSRSVSGMESMDDLHLLEAHEIVAMLKAGSVSPLQLIDVVEQRISATEPLVHATPITCFDRAREKAWEIMRNCGENSRGFLYGLPILIKDTHAVAGVRFTEGSLIHAERVSEASAALVQQLEAKGAIIVGKTNVPEFCAGSQSFNSVFPTTVSPWDVRTTSGGSSGGSAAALASYQCWLATGTDLGGSVRQPAAHCGAVGFRVSPGRTPGDGYGPLLGLHSISGPMARSVRDVALFLDAMESNVGWEHLEPHSCSEETFEAAAIRGASEGIKGLGLKVGFSTVGCHYSPELEALCRKAAWLLNNQQEPLEVGDLVDFPLAQQTFQALRAEQLAEKYGELLDPATRASVKPELQWNILQGQRPDSHRQAEIARGDLKQLQSQVLEMFKLLDILCVPATIDAAFDAEVRYPSKINDRSFSSYLGQLLPTATVSVLLCPALALPCGFLEDGRPVGLQLVAPYGADALVLRAAAALEQHLALPKGCEPRRGTVALRTEGPRSAEEAAKHHGISMGFP